MVFVTAGLGRGNVPARRPILASLPSGNGRAHLRVYQPFAF